MYDEGSLVCFGQRSQNNLACSSPISVVRHGMTRAVPRSLWEGTVRYKQARVDFDLEVFRLHGAGRVSVGSRERSVISKESFDAGDSDCIEASFFPTSRMGPASAIPVRVTGTVNLALLMVTKVAKARKPLPSILFIFPRCMTLSRWSYCSSA